MAALTISPRPSSLATRVSLLALGVLAGAGARAQGVTFLPPVELAVGDNPEAIAVGFINGDNFLDVVVANGGSNNVSVLLGNGDGTFANPVNYDAGAYPWYVALADLNLDGNLDLVVSNHDSGDLTVLLGAGDGTFQFASTVPLSDTPFSVAIADFNSDGLPDLAVTNLTSTFLAFGNGDGTFQSPVQLTEAGDWTMFVATADFNGDSIPDLVVTNTHGIDTATILLGQGDGTFQVSGNFSIG